MTIEREGQLDKLRTVGNLVARTLAAMGKALEPGMTTKELDDLGRALLERQLNEVGRSIESFARTNGYSIVRNLASHGVGRSLHDEPAVIPTWYEPRDKRTIPEGLVFTIEPFLSLGADWVEQRDDGWSLRPPQHQPTVQYEHTLVATSRGPLILTLA
jgi:methionine aminopeptidase